MSSIPFLILSLIITITVILPIIGYMFRSKFPISALLFICGAIWFLVFIINDEIELTSAAGYNETAIYTLDYPMNVTTGSAINQAFSTTTFGIAQHVSNINSVLYNQPISCISPYMSKTGAPTGTVTIGVFDEDNNVVKQFGTMTNPNTDLSTSNRKHTFCLSNHDYYTLQLGDYVGAKHTTSTGTDAVRLTRIVGSFDGTDSHRALFTTLWTDTTTDDLKMVLTYDNIEIINEPDTYTIRNPDTFEPTITGMFLIVLSLGFIMTGVLVERE